MVPYLDVQHLSKSFGALTLFHDISFSIGEGQRVGLIAKNGTGKSTLLSILCGKEGYDSGSIVFRRDLKVGMLEQSPVFDPDESVLDACFNHQGEEEKVLKAKQVLTQLKIRDLNQRMGELSGGQQKRVALANVLLTEPDLLILDEPTNHLDLEMIEWLEGYLGRGTPSILIAATMPIIWRSVRNVSTTDALRWRAPTICIARSWNGCVACRRREAIRHAIARRRSTNWKR